MKLIGNVLLWVVKFVLLLPFRILALIGCFVMDALDNTPTVDVGRMSPGDVKIVAV